MNHSYKLFLAFACIALIGQGCLGGPVALEPADSNGTLLDASGLNCRGVRLDGSTGVPVDVIKLDDGYCYPEGIFTKPTEPDECRSNHFHYTLVSIDGSKSRENIGACGAASTSDFENKGTIYVNPEIVNNWNALWPNAYQGGEANSTFEFLLEVDAARE